MLTEVGFGLEAPGRTDRMLWLPMRTPAVSEDVQSWIVRFFVGWSPVQERIDVEFIGSREDGVEVDIVAVVGSHCNLIECVEKSEERNCCECRRNGVG